LERLSFLVGRWEGTSEGQPGNGTAQREYTRALNSRFIRVTNRTVYPVQDKNPRAKFTKTRGSSVSTADASGSFSGNSMWKAS
jgi:hypothetical protein